MTASSAAWRPIFYSGDRQSGPPFSAKNPSRCNLAPEGAQSSQRAIGLVTARPHCLVQ